MKNKENKESKIISKTSNLDEHQEQVLLKIERNCCWFAFWGLLIIMAIQMLMGFGREDGFKNLAGEWIIFMCMALYLVIACAKNGIWDRRLKQNTTTNLVCSAVTGVVVAIFNFVMVFKNVPDKLIGSMVAGVFMGCFTFVLVFVSLEIVMRTCAKRQKKLEEEPVE